MRGGRFDKFGKGRVFDQFEKSNGAANKYLHHESDLLNASNLQACLLGSGHVKPAYFFILPEIQALFNSYSR